MYYSGALVVVDGNGRPPTLDIPALGPIEMAGGAVSSMFTIRGGIDCTLVLV